MRSYATIAAAIAFSALSVAAEPAANYRVLALDNTSRTRAKVVLIDVGSGKTVASANADARPDIAVSPDGKTVAVLSDSVTADRTETKARLTLYDASNLKPIRDAQLPFEGRSRYLGEPAFPFIQFAPSGKTLIVQETVSRETSERPRPFTFDEARLRVVTTVPGDELNYTVTKETVSVPRCRVVKFISIKNWPVVVGWNGYLGTLQLLDFDKGDRTGELRLDDEDAITRMSVTDLRKPEIGKLYLRLNQMRGEVQAGGERYAYYIPQQPSRLPYASQRPGFFKKIDLAATPPKVVSQSKERTGGLRAWAAAASDAARAIFVVKENLGATGYSVEKSAVLRVFSTDDFREQEPLELSIRSCDYLTVSADGKKLFALDRTDAKIAVIDASTRREEKVLDRIGKAPSLIGVVPAGQQGQ